MIAFAIQFVIFIVVVVIIGLSIQWALAKFGFTPDPTLKYIIGLIIFLGILVLFLNNLGYMSGLVWMPRR